MSPHKAHNARSTANRLSTASSGWTDKIVAVASIGAAAAAVVVAATFLADRFAQASGQPQGDDVPIAVSDWLQFATGGHATGPPYASVTLVEFGDYQCPSCRVAEPHMAWLRQRYGDKVRFVYRHFPLSYHTFAYSAARAAECAANQGRFWEYHRLLYTDLNWMGRGLSRFAIEAGVTDIAKFETCLDDQSPVKAIEADLAAARDLGAAGTPTVLINGLMLQTGFDSLSLARAVEQQLRISTDGAAR